MVACKFVGLYKINQEKNRKCCLEETKQLRIEQPEALQPKKKHHLASGQSSETSS